MQIPEWKPRGAPPTWGDQMFDGLGFLVVVVASVLGGVGLFAYWVVSA